jgi:hypothetical protein
MAIQQAQLNQVKTDANISVVRAKARAAQVTANAHVLKVKRMINKPQPKGL